MQQPTDQYGNYQATLAGNGILPPTNAGGLEWFFANYAGSVPSFTPVATAAAALDIGTGNMWYWANHTWTQITTGGSSGSVQVLGGDQANPNTASVFPTNKNLYAVYKQDSNISVTNLWYWSVDAQTWVQFSG